MEVLRESSGCQNCRIAGLTPTDLRLVLATFPTVPLVQAPSLVEPMPRLAAYFRDAPHLFIKRDDALAFGFGGNKVRKLAFVAADATRNGADTLITAGGVQSNHARVTACAAAKLGLRAILVASGAPPPRPTANALLDSLLGAEIVYVPSRDRRARQMEEIADGIRAEGGRPYVIPIGASTPLGALGFVLAVAELLDQMPAPDAIVHSTSSGGTQAGLVAGCRLLGLPTRVIGISADDTTSALERQVAEIVSGIADLLDVDRGQPQGLPLHQTVADVTPTRTVRAPGAPLEHARERPMLVRGTPIEVDDRFVGEGYGVPTDASREAVELAARTEAIFLDPVYTSKAMAGLIAYVRENKFDRDQTVLFWHTGGQVGLFT